MARRLAPTAVREERRARVVELLLAGRSLSEIAAEVGASKSTISGDVGAIRREWRATRTEAYEEQVGLEEARLSRLLAVYWGPATSGDLDAAEFCLRAIAQRCKLLGLDAATRLELGIDLKAEVSVFTSVEFIESRCRLLAALAPWPEARVAAARALAPPQETTDGA
jgi:hypothetical protein